MRKKITEKMFFIAHVPVDGVTRAIVGERVDIGADHDGAGDVYYFLPRLRDTAGRFMGTPAATDPANPAETIIINKIANTALLLTLDRRTFYRSLCDLSPNTWCVCVCFEYKTKKHRTRG